MEKANRLRLINESHPEVAVIRQSDIVPLASDDGKFRSYPLFPFDPQPHLEIYSVVMDPESVH
ncbi:hypothetical protein MHH52_16305 [Paenibacillus sp. FSL K6-0276]|uniref:hypothetical protein n=1 Tax=Paenibacillus sp. FSL K6-0276 TaxID=2921450 RepID=UPI0030ED4DC2